MEIGSVEVYGVIYKITNKVNGKIYIGQTTRKKGFKERYEFVGNGIERVYNYHQSRKVNNEQYNKHLLSSIKKYGFDSFEVDEIFDEAYSKDSLNDLEVRYIEKYNTTDRNFGYNKKTGGNNGKLTLETREKISISNKGKNMGENHPMYGKHLSEETKKKISESKKGMYTKEKSFSFGRVGKLNGKSVEIQCLTTGEIFESANIASNKYGCDRSSIIKNCKGKRKTAGKLNDGTPLKWRYYKIN